MTFPPIQAIDNGARYCGLYVFDFGEWTSVGYTAEEIAMLFESEQFRHGKAFRVQRISPDGQWELMGVAPERFQFESGMFFYRSTLEEAKADYTKLCEVADQTAPPGRCFAHLSRLAISESSRQQFVVALIYPAELEPDVSRWLLEAEYDGGDTAEGGVSMVTTYRNLQPEVLDRRQFWSAGRESRSADEVYANVRRAVQR